MRERLEIFKPARAVEYDLCVAMDLPTPVVADDGNAEDDMAEVPATAGGEIATPTL